MRSTNKPPQAALGASPKVLPAVFICFSNAFRAAFQAFFLSGTSQLQLLLQEFCPAYSPQPPWPLHAFSPLQECASTVAQLPIPAHELSPPLAFPLHVFKPRHTCFSPSSRDGSCVSAPSAAWPARAVPSTMPPNAAIVSLPKSRRDKAVSPMILRCCTLIPFSVDVLVKPCTPRARFILQSLRDSTCPGEQSSKGSLDGALSKARETARPSIKRSNEGP